MSVVNYALVPPESPALNGGDWLDLGTMECPGCDGDGNRPVPGQRSDATGWRVEPCYNCDASGRVPVVPTWTCPTCGGGGRSQVGVVRGTEAMAAALAAYGAWPACSTCNGEGVVHEGWLALGAAAHALGHPDLIVPASLSELVRVKAYPVHYAGEESAVERVEVFDNGSVWHSAPEDESAPGEEWTRDITDQFTSPPKPGGWVWRIVERVTLSDPITGYPCRQPGVDMLREIARREHAECNHEMAETVTRKANEAALPERPLPQQVGWYQADDALVAEIERRKP